MEKDFLEYALEIQCQDLHLRVDEKTQLKAIIAIHNTNLGPALGGCRCIEYPSSLSAVMDAMRLAQAMSYKAAMSELPLGGGKMVLLKPPVISDRAAYFTAVGRFVDSLRGQYITAVDSGTSVSDMDLIATQTSHVTSTSRGRFSIADPSLLSARGVERGIRAAVQFKLGIDDLKGLRMNIQGLGHAGYPLAQRLYKAGCELTVYDREPHAVERCIKEMNVKVATSLEELLEVEAEVFSPCALGSVINHQSIPLIKAPIVAGVANNQLQHPSCGKSLMDRGILYAPDYVINAGGLIYVATQYGSMQEPEAIQKVDRIYDTLLEIFKRSKEENRSTSEVADDIARSRIYSAKN